MGARADKYKLGARAGKYKLGARAGKYKLGAGGRETQTPQKNKERELLKNWRPISLLCVDYKILTKIISNRLKPTLDVTISKEQTCGIPNRSIFSNLFTIWELIHHSNKKDIKAYIVTIDQEKAFGKVDRDFLYKIMEKLGYSNTFISFIKKIYKNTQSVISNNGYLGMHTPHYREELDRDVPCPSFYISLTEKL